MECVVQGVVPEPASLSMDCERAAADFAQSTQDKIHRHHTGAGRCGYKVASPVASSSNRQLTVSQTTQLNRDPTLSSALLIDLPSRTRLNERWENFPPKTRAAAPIHRRWQRRRSENDLMPHTDVAASRTVHGTPDISG